jgi:hypothetical protein
VLCDPQPRFDATHRLRQLSEYNSRYRLPVARQEIGLCCHWDGPGSTPAIWRTADDGGIKQLDGSFLH